MAALVAVAICAAATAQPNASGEYRVYSLQYKSAADVERMLSDMLADQGAAAHVVADVRRNQLLLRGPETAQRIARELIASVDRPPAGTAPAAPAVSAPVVKGYPCPKARLAETAERLRSRYGDADTVRIATDAATSQLLILAPPEVHAMIARELASADVPAAPSEADAKALAARIPDEQFVGLVYSKTDQVQPQLETLLGSRLEPLPKGTPDRPDYLFTDAAGQRVELSIDRQRNGVLIAGSRSLVGQFVRLIRALDTLGNPQHGADRTIRIVPVHRADPAKVREAVDAYRTGSLPGASGVRAPATRLPEAATPETPAPETPAEKGTGAFFAPSPPGDGAKNAPVPFPPMGWSDHGQPGGIDLVQYTVPIGQPATAGGGAPEAQPIAPRETEQPKAAETAKEEAPLDRLRELGEEVEMEILPDLDAIILRGRQRDIDEVSRIIAEIERLSAVTQPVIDIYALRHVQGEALVELINVVAQDLAGGRQGSAHVVPLVKPNALLLIGWGEALAAIKELIAKLDQPVAPETQLRVFPLRYAAAAPTSATVEGFFATSTGLGPRVQVEPNARTNSLIVRASPRDMAEVAHLIAQLDRARSDAVNQARIFKLTNSLANDLATTIQNAIAAAQGDATRKSAVLELLTADVEGQRIVKSGILSDAEVIPDAHTNTLIVSAPAETMELLATLIQQLDSPTAVAQIKVFVIRNGDANSLVLMLRTLLPAQAGVAGPQLAGAEGETTLVPVRFAVDTRTNSIIATGSEGDLAIIEALLLRLDAEEIEQRKSSVYRLKNSPAIDVAQAINEYLRSKRTVEMAIPAAESPFLRIEREVLVVPEPVTNSLIISAMPRYYDEIEELVQTLDKAPAQVMIQVVIAEVELNDVDEFGVELGIQDSLLFDRSLLGDLVTLTESTLVPGVGTVQNERIIAADLQPGFNFNNQPLGNTGSERALARSDNVAGQALSSFSLGRTNTELGYGGLVLAASSESISVLIRALQEKRRLDVLGRPQIMTLDNQPAYIQVGKAVPRIVGTRFDGNVQVNQIDLEPTGLILGVTPRVSPEGQVVMEIDATKSELGPEAEGIPVSVVEGTVIRQPSINITMAQTTVSAASGETIVLGGLITKRDISIHRRVPWLYQVPVLGNLFRYDNESGRRTELLIILTPHVVNSEQEAQRIKQIEAARMSWCLDDVRAIHGPIGLPGEGDPAAWEGQGDVIYPDVNPRGLKPGEYTPQDVFPDNLPLAPPLEEMPEPPPFQQGRGAPPPKAAGAAPNGEYPNAEQGLRGSGTRADRLSTLPASGVPGPETEHASWPSAPAMEALRGADLPQRGLPRELLSIEPSIPAGAGQAPDLSRRPPGGDADENPLRTAPY